MAHQWHTRPGDRPGDGGAEARLRLRRLGATGERKLVIVDVAMPRGFVFIFALSVSSTAAITISAARNEVSGLLGTPIV